MGIWFCNKCNTKFTGKAYTIAREIKFEKEEEKTEGRPKKAEGRERAGVPKEKKTDETASAVKESAGEQ